MKLEDLNFKCILDTVEKRKALQEALFRVGGMWIDESDRVVGMLKEPMFVVERGIISYLDETAGYIDDPIQELTYEQAMAEIAKVKAKPNGEWVDFDIDDNCLINSEHGNLMGCSPLDHMYIIRNEHGIKAFGGVSYIESISGKKSVFTTHGYVGFRNGNFIRAMGRNGSDVLPVFPHQIRFFVEANNE